MSKPKHLFSDHPENFQKFHQKKRLETIIRNCFHCAKPTVYIYKGNVGVPWKPEHLYECIVCGVHYTVSKKVKT